MVLLWLDRSMQRMYAKSYFFLYEIIFMQPLVFIQLKYSPRKTVVCFPFLSVYITLKLRASGVGSKFLLPVLKLPLITLQMKRLISVEGNMGLVSPDFLHLPIVLSVRVH